MSKKKDLPKRWQTSDKAIRAMQWAFDVGQSVQRSIRIEAAAEGISPSDRLRQILNLEVRSKQTRPRLTLSLNQEDLALLAKRYGLSSEDTVAVKTKAAEEIIKHVNSHEKDG